MKTLSPRPLFFLALLLLFIFILTACTAAPPPTLPPVPTNSPSPLLLFPSSSSPALPSTPSPTLSLESTLASPTPLATAGMIVLADWSPNGQWLAYWTFTPETLEALPHNDGGPYDMAGVLHFYELGTGQTCEASQPVSFRHPVFVWQEDGRAAILEEGGAVLVTEPCRDDFETLTGLEAQLAIHDPSFSSGGTFRVETTELAYDGETGVQSKLTVITRASNGEESGRVYWDVYLKVGIDPNPVWLTDDLLLIPETKARGPLLVTANGAVTEIAAELFGMTESCGGELCATGMRAVAFSNPETEIYHLAMYWNWYQEFVSPLRVMLYHPETQEIESFGFQEVFGFPSISSANWWMMSRGNAFWARMLDPVGGKLIQFQPGERPALSPDGERLAFRERKNITSLT